MTGDAAPTAESGSATESEVDRERTGGPTATGLFGDGVTIVRENPRVLLAMVLAGCAVAVVDWVRIADPVPVVEFVGLTDGRVMVYYVVMPSVIAGRSMELSTLADLSPAWVVWVVGLECFRTAAVVLAGASAFARALDVDLTASSLTAYSIVFGAFVGVGAFTPEISAPLIGGVVVAVLYFYVVVHLLAVPALLVDGLSIRVAISRSWGLASGHGWSLLAVVVALGLAAHALASLGGPVGVAAVPLAVSLVAALQVGIVVAFVRTAGSESRSGPTDRVWRSD
ncbi:MAG: hypothetical protein ABEJ86_01180 [Halococcoides sp.]